MTQIKSLQALRDMQQRLRQSMSIREKSLDVDKLVQIQVGMGDCGLAAGARAVLDAFVEKVEQNALPAVVTLTDCMGYCHLEPTVAVTRPGAAKVIFQKVDVAKVEEILDRYVLKGEEIEGIIPEN